MHDDESALVCVGSSYMARCKVLLCRGISQAIVHVLVSPLKPAGVSTSGTGRPDDASGKVTASDALPPVAGLVAAITSRMGLKDRCFVNRNVVATILTLLNSLRPEHVKGPDKSTYVCNVCLCLALVYSVCPMVLRPCRLHPHVKDNTMTFTPPLTQSPPPRVCHAASLCLSPLVCFPAPPPPSVAGLLSAAAVDPEVPCRPGVWPGVDGQQRAAGQCTGAG